MASGSAPQARGALGDYDLVDARALLGRKGALSVVELGEGVRDGM